MLMTARQEHCSGRELIWNGAVTTVGKLMWQILVMRPTCRSLMQSLMLHWKPQDPEGSHVEAY